MHISKASWEELAERHGRCHSHACPRKATRKQQRLLPSFAPTSQDLIKYQRGKSRKGPSTGGRPTRPPLAFVSSFPALTCPNELPSSDQWMGGGWQVHGPRCIHEPKPQQISPAHHPMSREEKKGGRSSQFANPFRPLPTYLASSLRPGINRKNQSSSDNEVKPPAYYCLVQCAAVLYSSSKFPIMPSHPTA